MKRVEVKLSLPVVAPLLDLIREMVQELSCGLAITLEFAEHDRDLQDAWRRELMDAQQNDCQRLLGLFGREFFKSGRIEFDEENSDSIVRACSAIRLRLRESRLPELPDHALESGVVSFEELSEVQRKAFTCYLFLATIQELIIQNLDPTAMQP